ncbi:hypothetical protein DL96DRAFT_1616620 [Flagelloscypha sp. PMI_526]|nr:hypothetical protein DL96DRAFT_1616620 [Flagelloscypha sp. PMI_526]
MKPVAALSLDGSAFLVLSELFILQEIMARLQSLLNLDSTPAPYDHFDVIGGSGFGGLLALLLGRLRMTVDATIAQFIHLYQVFNQKRTNRTERTNKFSECLKHLFQDQMMAEHNAACKSFVCAMPASYVTGYKPERFRNYLPPKFASVDCKIWEAARATTAHPALFSPISIGPIWGTMEYIDAGACGFGNPIELVVDETKSLFPSCTEFLFLSLGAGHPGVFVIDSSEDGWISSQRHIVEDCERLAEKMAEKAERGYVRLNVAQGFQGIQPHEPTEPGLVASHTRQYISTAVVDGLLDGVVQFLANRHRQSSTEAADQLALSYLALTKFTLDPRLDTLISQLPEVKPWDFELDRELVVRPTYRFFTGHVHRKRRLIQIFYGPQAKEHRDLTISTSIVVKHPYLHVIFRKSCADSIDPCIVFSNESLLPAGQQLSRALNDSNTSSLVFSGISLIGNIASALDFLHQKVHSFIHPNIRPRLEDFVVFAKSDGQFLLAFTPPLGETQEKTNFDPRLLQEICSQTIIEATRTTYRENLGKTSFIIEGEDEDKTPTTELPFMFNSSQPIEESLPDSDSQSLLKDDTDLRLFTWMNHDTSALTLASISKTFEQLIERNRSALGLQRIFQLSTPPIHGCPGYRRDEIRLSLRATSNAVVIYNTPNSGELCIICQQYHPPPAMEMYESLLDESKSLLASHHPLSDSHSISESMDSQNPVPQRSMNRSRSRTPIPKMPSRPMAHPQSPAPVPGVPSHLVPHTVLRGVTRLS